MCQRCAKLCLEPFLAGRFLLQCDLVFAFETLISDDADLLHWTPERASTVSPLSWTSNFTLVLDAGANQHGVTLLAGRLSGPAMCRFGPAPWSGRAVSEEDEEDENEELFSRGSPPSPWPMVEGGWGELYCSQNVKRSLPITVKQSLSQKGHGKEGVVVGPHGAPSRGNVH